MKKRTALKRKQLEQRDACEMFQELQHTMNDVFERQGKGDLADLIMAASEGVYDRIGGPGEMFDNWDRLIKKHPALWKQAKQIIHDLAKTSGLLTLKECEKRGYIDKPEE